MILWAIGAIEVGTVGGESLRNKCFPLLLSFLSMPKDVESREDGERRGSSLSRPYLKLWLPALESAALLSMLDVVDMDGV